MKYEVAVRTLCEFTAKRGDLDMRSNARVKTLTSPHRSNESTRRGPLLRGLGRDCSQLGNSTLTQRLTSGPLVG